MCRVVGCDVCAPNQAHYCRVCKTMDVTHRSANCPTNSISNKRCRVKDCNVCPPNQPHYCKVCKTWDVTHRSANCPQNVTVFNQTSICIPSNTNSSNTNISNSSKSNTNWIPLQNSTLTFSPDITVSSVSVFKRENGKIYVLVGQRGVNDSWHKKICTFGGSIDRGETPIDAGIREALEEGGITIEKKDLKLFGTHDKFANFYCIYDREPTVLGPRPESEWEIYKATKDDSFSLEKEFNASIIKNSGIKTGLAWIEVNDILKCKNDFVKSSPSTKIISYMRIKGII